LYTSDCIAIQTLFNTIVIEYFHFVNPSHCRIINLAEKGVCPYAWADYLAHLLANWGKIRYALRGGKIVKYTAKPPVQGRLKAPGSKKTGRPEKYHTAFAAVLLSLWEFFDFQCGKLLAPLIKGVIGFLVQEFNLSEDIRALLLSVSPATIRLVQEPGWFLNKLSKILRILQFFIGSCSEGVYSFLNPLLNYWYPTFRLIAKEKLPSGRYKKIYEKEPKTPYQWLLESPDISEGCKDELRRRAAALNQVALKRCLDEARDRLLKLSVIECNIPSDKVS
jgi:hypothetical protein